ncbi:hybrid sensor histidine kinase/response regulator [Maribacter polysiphoniae]|uniref:hybrid sensor histidine kinase/response regulator n=1 Tax=Maribacter polysiphoniae TaxID=429344 RepID=UPI002354CC5A|nr:ATP-binding protein [Maribacter polysiphoniae]
MTLLSQYKEQYINQSIQFVVIDLDGKVLESDQTFITLKQGGFIYGVHPFFISYSSILDSTEDSMTYNCVHLGERDMELITDVRIIKKDNHLLLVIYDLTEHYVSYQRIAQARNESIINSELVVLKNMELEERERFKNAFIQNFSHELRNPLTSIISITNLLEKTNLDNEQHQMVDFLKESNTNLRLLLDDILSISMIASGRLQLRNKVFNLLKLLELIAFTYTSKTKGTSISFLMDHDQKIPEFIEGDRLRLFQVLTNLLDNAIKFTEKGTIALKVVLNQKRANKVSLRFEVNDTGIGIPSEKMNSVFESFTQLNEEGKKEGAGLGLSIVKGLVELMGSEIKAESKSGKGSSFYFDVTLTYAMNLASKPIGNTTSKKVDITKLKGDRKYKVLLVEDDERTQMVLFKTLMDTNLFFIDLVNDGAMVFETVINNNYDIILMDVDLPNVSGDQITKLIRDFPFKNIKNIPIIGVTANVFEDNIDNYLKIGMNAVVPKPFDFNELLKAIVKLLK